jgi:hypothetical protein
MTRMRDLGHLRQVSRRLLRPRVIGSSSIAAIDKAPIQFIGIGAQKCGTTWLYEHLLEHPQLQFPAGKETHFWDQSRPKGVSIDLWLDQFRGARRNAKVGEITPAYSFLEEERIKEMFGVAPHLRLFLSVRNPMGRAWSHALMALGRAEMLIHEASDQWFLDHFHSEGSRSRGDYPRCINTWRSVFPPSSLQIIVFDDICNAPRKVLTDLATHLGVDGSFYDSVPQAKLELAVFQGPGDPIRPSLLPYLRELYEPVIMELSDMIDRDLSHWLTWDGST